MALGAAEAFAELDGLVDHHLERRLRMRDELVGADVEDRALDRREPGEVAVQIRDDEPLQLDRAVAHTGEQPLDEAPVALVETLEAARLLHRIGARDLPSIKRLQRELAGMAPSVFHSTRS